MNAENSDHQNMMDQLDQETVIDGLDHEIALPLLGKLVHDLGGEYFIPADQLGTNDLYSLELIQDHRGLTLKSKLLERTASMFLDPTLVTTTRN